MAGAPLRRSKRKARGGGDSLHDTPPKPAKSRKAQPAKPAKSRKASPKKRKASPKKRKAAVDTSDS